MRSVSFLIVCTALFISTPGVGQDASTADHLATSHRVIAVDYPGIGYSSGTLHDDIGDVAQFVDDFAKTMKLEEFALLGWS